MNGTSTPLTQVRVFDGQRLTDPQTVLIEDGVITSVSPLAAPTTTSVDGHGATLLPGLIDSHVHIIGPDDVLRAAQYGVTTMLDMATPRPDLLIQARGRPGLPDIRTTGIPASGPGGMQTTRMGFPQSSVVRGPGDAERFVAERVAEHSDYIKIIVEDPQLMGAAALDGPTIAAIVQAAHARLLRVFAHVTTLAAVRLAADAGVDVLTHAPIDAPVDAGLVASLASGGAISVPTLVMMRAVKRLRSLPTHEPDVNFNNAKISVATFQRAGIPVIAGTDANMAPGSPFTIVHGESLHDELELLVAAGLTPLEALRSATSLPATRFDLGDRGAIEPGATRRSAPGHWRPNHGHPRHPQHPGCVDRGCACALIRRDVIPRQGNARLLRHLALFGKVGPHKGEVTAQPPEFVSVFGGQTPILRSRLSRDHLSVISGITLDAQLFLCLARPRLRRGGHRDHPQDATRPDRGARHCGIGSVLGRRAHLPQPRRQRLPGRRRGQAPPSRIVAQLCARSQSRRRDNAATS